MASVATTYVEQTVEMMCALLEQGVEPWQRGYNPELASPHNAHTGRAYRGGNVLRLMLRAKEMGFGPGGGLTFQQALQRGGAVKKGEKGCAILAFGAARREEEQAGEGKGRLRSFARAAHVFHISQCEGLEGLCPVAEPMEGLAAKLIEAHGVQVEQGPRPCYVPLLDVVEMPPAASYDDPTRREAVLLHELVHWSGAVGRLHRSFGRWGEAAYAFEELVAELGAATLCRHAGLPGLAMQAAYVEHWLTHLKADPQLLWHVMRLAEEAVAYLLAPLDAELAALDDVA